MRDDFNRVLTEDPRRGSRWKFREYRRSKGNAVFDDEFSGGKESMMKRRRIAGGDRKRFGDHLSPLRRFIASQVGKKWDDVYSEISSLFDRRRVTHDHVHQHVLRDFVELDTRLIDGKVCVLNRWDGWKEVGTQWARRDFYVHPVTGILCSTKKEDRPAGHAKKAEEEAAARRDAVFRAHDRDTHLYFEDGIWWVYTIKDRPLPYFTYICPRTWTLMERLRWDKMSLEEREQEGDRVLVTPVVKEFKAPNVNRTQPRGWGYYNVDMCPKGRYYAMKQVANRKLLKAHGLVGTATPKEEEGKRSHREMSKYRIVSI